MGQGCVARGVDTVAHYYRLASVLRCAELLQFKLNARSIYGQSTCTKISVDWCVALCDIVFTPGNEAWSSMGEVMVRDRSGYYARWASSKRIVAAITTHLASGGEVVLSTAMRHVICRANHAGMFKATSSGAFIQRGKGWDCINGCKITLR